MHTVYPVHRRAEVPPGTYWFLPEGCRLWPVEALSGRTKHSDPKDAIVEAGFYANLNDTATDDEIRALVPISTLQIVSVSDVGKPL